MHEACVVSCAESAQEDGELARERQAAQAAVEETRGAKPQTKVSQRKLNQVKVRPACLKPFCPLFAGDITLLPRAHGRYRDQGVSAQAWLSPCEL